MLAQKPHLKFVSFADKKIVGAIVAKFHCTPCQLSSRANNDLVCIKQA
jgi:hypothetical protein